jgi:glycine dehydrogenase subunit 2
MDELLNAIYTQGLEPFSTCLTNRQHAVVFSDDRQAKLGVRTGDIAKRLIGYHPYTVSFPMIVHGAHDRAHGPEGKLEIDNFIDAMISIAHEIETDHQMRTRP